MEIWDCYDKDFNLIENKTLIRGQHEFFGQDEYHLVCDVAVKHVDGTYLLMRRDFNKEGYPGMWELSAGGSALKGEKPLECAKRELQEETGIIADEIVEVGRFTIARNHCHYVEYLATTSCDKDSIVLQAGETIDYKWVEKEEVINLRKEICSSRIFKCINVN